MKYLITGCCGFIGYHVAQNLLNKNNLVIGVDNLNRYYDYRLKTDRLKKLKNKKFKFFKFNLSNKNKLKKIFKDFRFDYVIHLAAQAGVRYSMKNPYTYINSNISATTNLLECCKEYKPKKILLASSSSVYGTQKTFDFKETMKIDKPISFYAASKISMENIAYYYSNLYKMPLRVLRFFTVYGPWGRPDMAYYKFTQSIINNKKIDVYNNGNHFRDFTYITDIVKFISKIIQKDNKTIFEILNLGRGNPQKLKKFISIIENKLQKKAIKNYLSLQDGDMLGTLANMNKFKKKYNLKAEVNLDLGISKFVDWYLEYFKIKNKY
jgi:UDP-glucuronate 4-epimerase